MSAIKRKLLLNKVSGESRGVTTQTVDRHARNTSAVASSTLSQTTPSIGARIAVLGCHLKERLLKVVRRFP